MTEIKQIFKKNAVMSEDDKRVLSPLAFALRHAVSEKGTNIYTDKKEFETILKSCGIGEIQLRQVDMILSGSSFIRYLDHMSEGISAVEINNIMKSAMSTGLSLDTIQNVVSDLLYGIGINQTIMIGSFDERRDLSIGNGVFISPYACRTELDKLEDILKSGEVLTDWQFGYINYCHRAGIPKASRLLGMMFQQGLNVEESQQKAEEYLGFAVSMGDAESMLFMGDCCFEQARYDEAYIYYTSPGTYAVDQNRRKRVQILCNTRSFNIKEKWAYIILAVILEIIILFFMPESEITGNHNIAKVVCSILNAGSAAAAIWYNRCRPFSDLRKFGSVFAAVMFLYAFMYIVV